MNGSRLVATMSAIPLLLVLTTIASAAEEAPHPGIVSINWQQYTGNAEPKVSVNLNQALLRFVTSVASEAATEVTGIREIIGQLRQVRVEVYEGVGHSLAEASDTEAKKLQEAGWTTVVRAYGDDGERVNVMMLPNDESIAGLVVIAAGPDEMAFVNVAGELDPESLGKHLGALARMTHNGKIKLEDLINKEAIEVIIEQSANKPAGNYGNEPHE